LSACVPQTVSQGRKVTTDTAASVAQDQGALSPDIKKILAAGGLDATNPAGPAEIPAKIGAVAPEPEKTSPTAVTELASAASLQSPGAYPAGDVDAEGIADVLPPVSKFVQPTKTPVKKRNDVQVAKSKKASPVVVANGWGRQAPVQKVRRF